jgi:hypothetical protein
VTIGPLTARFLDAEVTEYERSILIRAAGERSARNQYFAFNVFNVRLDFENEQATVEDELDAGVEESLPLSELISALVSMGPR